MSYTLFKKGDIITPSKDSGSEYLNSQPILVLSNMNGSEDDGMCNLMIGMSGRLIKFRFNPRIAKIYTADNSYKYMNLKSISNYMLGEISEADLKAKIGEAMYNELKNLL